MGLPRTPHRKQGVAGARNSASLPPLAIRHAAHKTALREIDTQKEQFQRLGIMADWSNESTYRTIDHIYQMRQLRVFRDMVENGLIYRRYRPVHFSPSSRSALAEAELVYKDDHVSHSVFVTFKLKAASCSILRELSRDIQLLVWTTTPWTLTANMAIAVHPDLLYVVRPSVPEMYFGDPGQVTLLQYSVQ
ncbi:tRNA synthetases class I-domain-containing protein [Mycena vitilis]|nr:tRNA synthetases class I-domain-containing protein [Mycena vitilis]